MYSLLWLLTGKVCLMFEERRPPWKFALVFAIDAQRLSTRSRCLPIENVTTVAPAVHTVDTKRSTTRCTRRMVHSRTGLARALRRGRVQVRTSEAESFRC